MLKEALPRQLESRVGTFTLERLGGLSGRAVYRMQLQSGVRLLKTDPHQNEVWFYKLRAPELRMAGIGIPKLEASGDGWLLLEWLPAPLPETRWLADPEVLRLLARLHEFAHSRDWQSAFQPQWTTAMTEHVVSLMPPARTEEVRRRLEELRVLCLPLFEPHSLISGDPNPRNWGLRADGTVNLFDWERFTSASPLIDLAITVPGLGQRGDFQCLVDAYNTVSGGLELSGKAVAELVAAKAWTVVELLEKLDDQEIKWYLVNALPDWLERVSL